MATGDDAVKKPGLQLPQLPAFLSQGKPGPAASSEQQAEETAAPKPETDELVAARPFRRVGVIIPGGLVSYFERKLQHAGIREDTRVWLGKRLLASIFTGFVLLLLYLAIFNPIATPMTALTACGLFLLGFLGLSFLFYMQLYFRIADRTATLEKVLPDFLLITASNMRAGLSPFPAFLQAAKPEFGALYDEVILAMAKTSGTSSIVDALAEISVYFDSGMLQRITTLFGKGLRSGGQLAKLLRSSADEIRRIQDLRDELTTTTRSYTIFLGFIVVMIMPFLLAVSVHFLTVFLTLQPPTGAAGALPAGIPSFSGKVSITPSQMLDTAIITLAVTSLLVSSLVGIIGKGKALYGIKYFPLFLIGALGVFFMANLVIGSVLAGFGAVS
jgi:pilus assembly protein TadC